MPFSSQFALRSVTAALATALLLGCSSVPPTVPEEPPAFDARALLEQEREAAAQTEPPARAPVQAPQALEQQLLDFSQAPRSAPRFDVQATDVPMQRFFADLGRSQDTNILVDPSLTGNISLTMRSVTMEQVMLAVRDLYGFDYQRTNYGYRVLPDQIQTRIYRLNYLNVSRSGRSDTSVSGGQLTNNSSQSSLSSSVATETTADFWQGMEMTVLGLLNDEPGRQVVVNPQSGILVVRATPREHEVVNQFLDDAQGSLQKQVVIEAKVVEVTLRNEFRSGINWNSLDGDLAQDGFEASGQMQGSPLAGIANVGGVFSFAFNQNDFTSILQLLSDQGDVQVLSSPRVSTVNNQKAVIKVGTDEYFVTEVTSRVTEDGNGNRPEFTLSPFFSGISLDVTPQISADDHVILHVRPSVTEVAERSKIINVGGATYDLPLAFSSIRETDSIIRAASGQIVVIGGLLTQRQDSSVTGLPGLARVPGLNWFFSQNREQQRKSELVILLKPVVYGEQTTVEELDRLLNR